MREPAALGGTVVDIAIDADRGGSFVRAETLGSGPPVILLHGWTLDRRMWRPQLPLAEGFTLVAIDRRGFGQSTAPAGTGAEPDDVIRVADQLGLERFHLLGMSQAGRVALRVAVDHPERLLSLVVQGTPIDGVPQDDAPENVPIAAMAEAAGRGDLAAVRALWAAHPLVRLHDIAWQPLLDAMLADYDARDLRHPAPGVAIGIDDIAGIAVPVLAITGENDSAWRRQIAVRIAETVAAGTSATFPAAGHLCNMDVPQAYNALLARWLRG